MEQDLSILTPLQKEVYQWKVEQKKSYKGVAEELGLSPDVARRVYLRACRRLREWKNYHLDHPENDEPVATPFTRGELEVLLGALHAFEKRLLRPIRRNDTDPYGMLPYAGLVAGELCERIQLHLYGEIQRHTKLRPDETSEITLMDNFL